MKIAIYYSRYFESGGVEKTILERAKYLASKGNKITFIFSILGPLDMLDKYAEIGDVKRVDYCNEIFDYCIYDAVYNLKRVNAKRYIQVINGNLADSHENYEEVIPFNSYVAVSEEAARQFKERKGKTAIVIPNMINEEEILKLSKEKVDIPKAKYVFVTVSRLDPQKGFERIEKVIQKLEINNVDYHWIFVGSNEPFPQYGEELQERFKDYKCTFVGKQDNPYKYMAKANYLVQLSDYESQCMVMYESLICGTPCMCTDFNTAVETLKGNLGFTIRKDLTDLDINKLLKKKPKIEYHYPNYGDKWLELLEPIQKKDYKFSIIIPNYNNGKWLDKCLGSVLKQTYKNYEIIFIDDMSTDNSLEIANKLLKKHKVIALNQKRLNGGSRNVGILEATGDYIMCLDSDDWLANDKVLEKLNDFIDEEDIIRTGYSLSNGEQDDLFIDIPKHKNMYEVFIEPTCAIWTKVVKADILKNTLFREGTLMEDKVHHYRVVDKSNSFKDFPEVTHVWNRKNATSVTTKRDYRWNNCIYRHIADMLDFIEETNNSEYRNFVTDKVRQAHELAKMGDYKQI